MANQYRVEFFIKDDGEWRFQCRIVIDGVPYYGSGHTEKEAWEQLFNVIKDHGAPLW